MRAMSKRGLALALFEAGSLFPSLLGFGQTLLEFVNTTRGIHEHLLSCIEWMRLAADSKNDQWVLVSVFPLNSLVGTRTGLAQERKS